LYVAWKESVPAVRGPSEFELATPEARGSVPADDPDPLQVPLAKKVKLTVPVGVPAPDPVTVAWSVTVDPSATEVTADPSNCTVVVVSASPLPTENGSQGPVEAL
jgi:hypothetical protein